jgi:repressor LexA
MGRLKELRKQKGYTQAKVAKIMGISQNNYSYWENGKVKIDGESIKKLADLFGTSVDYILGRTEQPSPKLPPYKNIYPLAPPVKMSVLDEANAGASVSEQACFSYWEFPDEEYGDGNHFMLKVTTDSMAPQIPVGTSVIIRNQNYADMGQVIAFAFGDGNATLKRYYPQPDGTILLKGDNPASEIYLIAPQQLQTGDAHIIGRAIAYKAIL